MTVAQGWAAQTSGISSTLNSVYFVDANTGWAVGNNGTILKTTDGGTTWAAQTSGTSQSLNSVYFVNANTGWAVGTNGTIRKTTDGGMTWSAQNSGIEDDLYDLHFVNANTGWAVGVAGIIRKTTDGTNWSAQNYGSNTLYGVHFVDSNAGWAVGNSGTILSTINGGANWSAQTSGSNTLYGVHFVDATTGWAVGNSGTILSTINGGANWSAQTSVTSSTLNSVYFVNATTGWAVGNNGTILKYEGATPPAAPTNLAATPCGGQVAISFTAGSNGGSPITNYEYTLDGTNWTTFSPAVTGTTVTVTALSSGTYNISLRAVNSVGSGAASASVTATIDTNANVSVAYTGATIVIATNKSAPITLSAAVTLPGCATASQAELRFIDRDSGQPISGWLPITPGTPPNTGTATYAHILTLGTYEIFRKYNIGFEIGGAGIFIRNDSADKVTVTVAEPSCGCY